MPDNEERSPHELDFEVDLEIDKFNLDDEWVEQPSLIMRYGAVLAEVKRELADMQITLKVETAEKSLFYRLNPKDGLKVTESTVKEWVTVDTDLVRLQREIAEKAEEVEKVEQAVNAFQHRKHALIKISDLHMTGYHAGDSHNDTGKSSKPKSQRTETPQVSQSSLRRRK